MGGGGCGGAVSWPAGWEIATQRVARASATPGGASYSTELVALSAGVDSQRKILSVTSGLCRASCSLRVPLGAAPGYRDAGYYKGFGALRDVGDYGYSWSSTVSGSIVRFLDFNPTWLTPQNSNYRAYGFQLRCLQE